MLYWLDWLYSSPVALIVTLLGLSLIGVSISIGKGRQIILLITLLLYVRYMVWRGLYTLNAADFASTMISLLVYVAEGYGLFQFAFFTFQAWSPSGRRPVALRHYPTVDLLVTVVNEPVHILKRTLLGCLEQEYEKERCRVYVLDDGHRDEVKALAESLGCHYLRRPNRPADAKAGNLNYALDHSFGEFVAVFDVDHVPVSTFLRDTMGLFHDEQVAFIQTAHYFYNPDVFQKNLFLERELRNEQDLFFRVLQAGRDTHNSAFFAGSGGIFRRRCLEEIGGFQTDTITEDIHTSLLLHARGYKSCYLNRTLSAGLMPETFEGYIRQRTRWAIGCIQVLFKDNPLTKRGLTILQRIDYFGSIYYFLHGIPRCVCLIAPLFALLLHVSPLNAEPLMLVHLFGSYYAASVASVRLISRGTRNAFWSDIYEVAMCFSLSWAAIRTVAAPYKRRQFEVTPKGEQLEGRGILQSRFVLPHLVTFGLLCFGVTIGIQDWLAGSTIVGLEVSLFWGALNLFLLTVGISAASERRQGRKALRVTRHFPCELIAGSEKERGHTLDINEHGMAVMLDRPLMTLSEFVVAAIQCPSGKQISVRGRMIRQEGSNVTAVLAGLEFLDSNDPSVDTLIKEIFSHPRSWRDSSNSVSGLFRSLWAMITVLGMALRQSHLGRRRAVRVKVCKPCRLTWQGLEVLGATQDLSVVGVSALFPVRLQPSHEPALLQVGDIRIKVIPISAIYHSGKTLLRFRVDGIDHGEQQWLELHRSLSQRR